MRRLLVITILCLATMGSASGQSRELLQLQADVVKLSSQVTEMQKSLDERNAAFLQLIEQVVDQVAGLSDALERVTGTSDDVRTSNETLSGEMRVMMTSLRSDLELMDRNIRELGVRLDAISNQLTGINTTTTSLVSPSDKFAQAEGDLYQGNWELARRNFREFIAEDPLNPRADDAQLYIGDSYYSAGDFEQAGIEYGKLLQTYANSDKRAVALYKQGLADKNQGLMQSALTHFQQVVAEYPQSPEASLAQDEILAAQSASP